jgi:hypothetical protein
MAVQQGRSERRGESYSVPYVEPLSDARTPLADFFRILLERKYTSKLVRGRESFRLTPDPLSIGAQEPRPWGRRKGSRPQSCQRHAMSKGLQIPFGPWASRWV